MEEKRKSALTSNNRRVSSENELTVAVVTVVVVLKVREVVIGPAGHVHGVRNGLERVCETWGERDRETEKREER